MIQWGLAAFGPVGIAAALLITAVSVAVVVDSGDTQIWDDSDDRTPGTSVPDEDGFVDVTHSFRYWDAYTRFSGTGWTEESVRNHFLRYYDQFGSQRYLSQTEFLDHIPEGLEEFSEDYLKSLWTATWGTWDEASRDDSVYDDGDVTVPGSGNSEEDDDYVPGIILPGLVNPSENGNENGNESGSDFVYRTDPTVRYVSDYIYDYEYIYRYTMPEQDVDFDYFETDGEFTIGYYQDDYFDWGLYFLILFPILAAEILIFNRFRHLKVVP